MTGNTRGEPTPDGMDIAAETLADLDADDGVAGGMAPLSSPCAKTDDDRSCGVSYCHCEDASLPC